MGYAAVKYADLKNQRLTNYKFSFDDMLSLKGNTAVYLLYAHARIAGIVRKSNKDVGGAHPEPENLAVSPRLAIWRRMCALRSSPRGTCPQKW